ncbi:MAG: thiopurine S-methyltransferase [Kangiellaceae bacterium]|nr:thiopurine S-methyltransferase [Kangiellaceae bacterium]
MEAEFWLEKWESNEIGFHLSSVHPLLKKFNQIAFGEPSTVFVPLCGKSKDLAYLHSLGNRVIGNELSDVAVKSFFTEEFNLAEITLESTLNTNAKQFEYSGIKILTGDFFELQEIDIESCSSIYDRAALIALPKSTRMKYVEKIRSLFSHARLLLITLEYDQNLMSGPPFSVDKGEIESLFSFAHINPVYRKNIIDKEPKFMKRGLVDFFESAYIINW